MTAAALVDQRRDRAEHDGPDRDRRDEVAVADVEVEDAGACVEQRFDLLAEPREVGGVERWLDLGRPDVAPRHQPILSRATKKPLVSWR